MKYKLLSFVLLFSLMLIASSSFASAYNFVYDEIDDSSINTTLWKTATSASSSAVTSSISENSDRILATATQTGAGGTGISTATLNSKLLDSNSDITNVTFRALLHTDQDAGQPFHNETASISIFGTVLNSVSCVNSAGCSQTDDTVYMVIRNGTAGQNYWDWYDDGVYQATFQATNNNLTMFASMNKNVGTYSPGADASASLYYVYGQKINQTTTVHAPLTTTTLSNPVLFNLTSITDSDRNLTNATLYINGVLNETVNLNNYTDTYSFSKTLTKGVMYNWSVTVCDSDGFTLCSSTDTANISVQDWIEISTTAPSSSLVGETVQFSFLINVSSGTTIDSAGMVYNGTTYSVNINNLGGNQYNIIRSLLIPSPIGTIDYYLNFTLSTSEVAQTTTNQIVVTEVGVDDCSVFTNLLYNFTYKTEGDLIDVAGAENPIIEFSLNLYNDVGSVSVLNYSQNASSNNLAVCLETTDTGTLSLDAIVRYDSDNKYSEFYHINDATLTGQLASNISLYGLNNDSSSTAEFKITYKDSTFSVVPNAIVQIHRKYIDLNQFLLVEQPRNGDDGTTIGHFVIDDAIYKLVFIDPSNNNILATFDNVLAQCQNPTFEDCVINVNSFGSSISADDFNNSDDFSATLTFDKDTRIVTSNFIIASGTPASVDLNVTLFDNRGSQFICADSTFASSGTLQCTVPASFGNTTVIAQVSKNSVKRVFGFLSFAQDPSELYGGSLIFIGVIMFSLFIGMSITSNPAITLIFAGLGFVSLFGLGVLYTPAWFGVGATILWVMIAIVILLIKGGKR